MSVVNFHLRKWNLMDRPDGPEQYPTGFDVNHEGPLPELMNQSDENQYIFRVIGEILQKC